MVIPLGACASMSGFPEPVQPPATALAEVEDYLTLAVVNSCNRDPTRTCRNNIIDARIRASNIRFAEYERALYREGIGSGVGTDWAVLALNGIAAISTGAAPELAALSAGVLGGRSAYEKRALYDLSLPVMLAQMTAKRQEVLVRVRAGETKEVADYSLHRGLDDVAAYERAGSIPAAMSEMVTNAGAQARDAQKNLEEIELVTVVPDHIQARREPIAEKVKAADIEQLKLLLLISGRTPSPNPVVDALTILGQTTTAEGLDTFCIRLRLAVPNSGGC
jgi:hypothetical protein